MGNLFKSNEIGEITPVCCSPETVRVTISSVNRVSTLCDVLGYMRNYLHVMSLNWSDHKIMEFLKSDSDYHTSLENDGKTLLISYEVGFYSFCLFLSFEVINPVFF